MGEFTKAKIGFAIALLAALFTVHPLIVSATGVTFTVFSLPLRMAWFYYAAMGLFSFAVYLYALAFISDRASSYAERAGNIVYACALLIPPLYGFLFACSIISHVISTFAPRVSTTLWSNLLASGIGAVLSFLFTRMTARLLNSRDREAQAASLDREEIFHIDRAASTFRAGYFNFALIQAFQAIELALRRALLVRRVSPPARTTRDVIELAFKAAILPGHAREELDFIRRLRNRAAHDTTPIPQEEAKVALEKAQAILALIDRRSSDAPEDI